MNLSCWTPIVSFIHKWGRNGTVKGAWAETGFKLCEKHRKWGIIFPNSAETSQISFCVNMCPQISWATCSLQRKATQGYRLWHPFPRTMACFSSHRFPRHPFTSCGAITLVRIRWKRFFAESQRRRMDRLIGLHHDYSWLMTMMVDHHPSPWELRHVFFWNTKKDIEIVVPHFPGASQSQHITLFSQHAEACSVALNRFRDLLSVIQL